MKILLGLSEDDIEALRYICIDQNLSANDYLEMLPDDEEWSETEAETMSRMQSASEIMNRIVGLIDNQIELGESGNCTIAPEVMTKVLEKLVRELDCPQELHVDMEGGDENGYIEE